MRRQLTMLVIDDVEVNRASLRAIFEEEYKIIEAADGNAAILMLQKEAVDLVILDLCMPGMDGKEVLKQIRGSRKYKHIPVIVKSAIDETLEEEVLEAGADDFIFSPCNPEIIRKRVRNIAHKYIYEHEFLSEQMQRERYTTRARDNYTIVMVERLRQILKEMAGENSDGKQSVIAEQIGQMEQMLRNITEVYETGREYGTFRNRAFSIKCMTETIAAENYETVWGEKAEVIVEEETVDCEYLFGDEEHIRRIWENLLRAAAAKSKIVRTQYAVDCKEDGEVILTIAGASDKIREMEENSYLVTKTMAELLCGMVTRTEDTLRIAFPLNKGKAPVSQRGDFSSVRMLNVGDEEIYRDYYKILLNRLGMSYDVAADEAETMQCLEEAYESGDGFDICAVNWQMEGGCAPEIMRKIRKQYDRDTIVLVGFSGDMEKYADEMKAAGADYLLDKPLFQGTLYQMLSDICQGKLLERPEDGA